MIEFNLKFSLDDIDSLVARYWEKSTEKDKELELEIMEGIGPRVQGRGYFTREEFLKLTYWKTQRSKSHCEKNDGDYVQEVTRIAFNSRFERLRVETLNLLDGVGWPTASVLLHFGSKDPYPILDVRALWSLGIEKAPPYKFDFWWVYVSYCRDVAQRHKISMRCLDRALWGYSSKFQNSD